MTRKEELTAAIYAARTELDEIHARERDEQNQCLIGMCFKYRNCYSRPETPDDYWWLYARVIGVEDGCLRVWTFQTDKYGKVEIEPSTLRGKLGSGYEEIGAVEFGAAWQAALEKLERL